MSGLDRLAVRLDELSHAYDNYPPYWREVAIVAAMQVALANHIQRR